MTFDGGLFVLFLVSLELVLLEVEALKRDLTKWHHAAHVRQQLGQSHELHDEQRIRRLRYEFRHKEGLIIRVGGLRNLMKHGRSPQLPFSQLLQQ